MNRCDNCNVPCNGHFCCAGCEREYGAVIEVDWDTLECEVLAEIAKEMRDRLASRLNAANPETLSEGRSADFLDLGKGHAGLALLVPGAAARG